REETVEALELGSLLDRPVDTLSGGERQRVALGRALCSGPRLLLLDEPLSALDAGLRHRILPFLVRIREQFDLPMVVVSHQPVELQAICDEVSALREGRIVATAPPTQLFARPDIYPLAREGGRFENLLPAVVKTQDARTTELALGRTGTGPTLVAPPLDRAPGQRLTVTLPAQDIILALAPPTGLSARNLLAGKITNLQSADGQEVATLVFAGLPEHPVLVELTGTAVQDLQLRTGMGLWALFKSSALTVAG
ncbi:MAG: ATP-binding cassette domain-containing protein, partial [Opitutales bacterium]